MWRYTKNTSVAYNKLSLTKIFYILLFPANDSAPQGYEYGHCKTKGCI